MEESFLTSSVKNRTTQHQIVNLVRIESNDTVSNDNHSKQSKNEMKLARKNERKRVQVCFFYVWSEFYFLFFFSFFFHKKNSIKIKDSPTIKTVGIISKHDKRVWKKEIKNINDVNDLNQVEKDEIFIDNVCSLFSRTKKLFW